MGYQLSAKVFSKPRFQYRWKENDAIIASQILIHIGLFLLADFEYESFLYGPVTMLFNFDALRVHVSRSRGARVVELGIRTSHLIFPREFSFFQKNTGLYNDSQLFKNLKHLSDKSQTLQKIKIKNNYFT